MHTTQNNSGFGSLFGNTFWGASSCVMRFRLWSVERLFGLMYELMGWPRFEERSDVVRLWFGFRQTVWSCLLQIFAADNWLFLDSCTTSTPATISLVNVQCLVVAKVHTEETLKINLYLSVRVCMFPMFNAIIVKIRVFQIIAAPSAFCFFSLPRQRVFTIRKRKKREMPRRCPEKGRVKPIEFGLVGASPTPAC